MNRYNQGKIYKLVNTVDDKIYIGSTCMPLAKRKSNHKADARTRTSLVYTHLNSIGWENVNIRLIETVTAETKDQLLMREQHYIDLLKPELNKHSAINDCPHNRKKHRCKDCNGVGICPHNRRKASCKDCGGVSICPHNRRKSRCKDCGGSQMCLHNKRKSQCKDCSGDTYYCYECEQIFCGKRGLLRHETSKKHKDTYDRLIAEVFGD